MTVRVLLVLLVGLTAVLAIGKNPDSLFGMKPSNSSTTSGMRNLFRRKKTKVIVTETLLDPKYKTKGEKVIDAVVHFFQDHYYFNSENYFYYFLHHSQLSALPTKHVRTCGPPNQCTLGAFISRYTPTIK
jgi:hypothetical protein